MRRVIAIFFMVSFIFCACKDPFTPEVEAQYKNLLVVEGFINIGGETTIKLSRTGDLQDWQTFIPEKNATISIEGDNGTLLSGSSGGDGRCTIPTHTLTLNEKYRLKISTVSGKIYQTDYLENKQSPEIDSLSFKIENKGFQIYVSTHDDLNNTRYYNWDYTETWEIRSPFISYFEYKGGQVVERDKNVNITYCWRNNQSSNILLNTTERLSEDRLKMVPLNYIPGNSEKIAFLYSILVNQYGLTQEAYQYLENLKKNTENIGTIFDSQPSELKGNITCTSNPDELVLGWVNLGTVSEKRLFISAHDKPSGGAWQFKEICETFRISKDSLNYYISANNSILDEVRKDGVLTGYIMGKTPCVDCRLRGSNIKPDYWAN
ncbi:MAG TPA: DUF4249 domain-containing protein [Pelobium sp.]|nr:DUF4249 domain-containing protein [Pelobium sp.]